MMQCSHSSVFSDVIIIEPRQFRDERGYFFETFQAKRYAEVGIKEAFVQDNFSYSIKNTLRGLHYQLQNPQGKLVSVIFGTVYDVIVDIRRGSPTFGQYDKIELSAENGRQIYIPPGFAHGFYVASDIAGFYYKCTNYYEASDDYGILWSDEQINIAWPLLSCQPLLSPKDQAYATLAQVSPEHLPVYKK